jgi:hypothetical protein
MEINDKKRGHDGAVEAFLKCANADCNFHSRCQIQPDSNSNSCIDFQQTSEGDHSINCIPDENAIINQKARQQIIQTDADLASYTTLNASLRDPGYTSEAYVASGYFTRMQSFQSLQPAKCLKRLKTEVATNPNDARNIVIPPDSKYRLDNFEQLFLIANEPHNRGSILIFATNKFLEGLFCAKLVMMDGTFKCVPSIFKRIKGQLLCIHIIIDGVLYTLVYCLLPDKTVDFITSYLNLPIKPSRIK